MSNTLTATEYRVNAVAVVSRGHRGPALAGRGATHLAVTVAEEHGEPVSRLRIDDFDLSLVEPHAPRGNRATPLRPFDLEEVRPGVYTFGLQLENGAPLAPGPHVLSVLVAPESRRAGAVPQLVCFEA